MKSTRDAVGELDLYARSAYGIVAIHTNYGEKCECGEFLMKRDGPCLVETNTNCIWQKNLER